MPGSALLVCHPAPRTHVQTDSAGMLTWLGAGTHAGLGAAHSDLTCFYWISSSSAEVGQTTFSHADPELHKNLPLWQSGNWFSWRATSEKQRCHWHLIGTMNTPSYKYCRSPTLSALFYWWGGAGRKCWRKGSASHPHTGAPQCPGQQGGAHPALGRRTHPVVSKAEFTPLHLLETYRGWHKDMLPAIPWWWISWLYMGPFLPLGTDPSHTSPDLGTPSGMCCEQAAAPRTWSEPGSALGTWLCISHTGRQRKPQLQGGLWS